VLLSTITRMKQTLLILITLVAAGSIATASPITYNINFTTTSGLAPTSGSFIYDASTTTFSNFIVVWDTDSFDFTDNANTDGGCFGDISPATAFVFLNTGCGGTRSWLGFVTSIGNGNEAVGFTLSSTQGEISPITLFSSSPQASNGGGTFTISAATPEPAAACMFALGFAGFVMAFRSYGARVQRRATA